MRCATFVSPRKNYSGKDVTNVNKSIVAFANLDGFASAHFIVKAGENKLSRPVAGGIVSAGVLKSHL